MVELASRGGGGVETCATGVFTILQEKLVAWLSPRLREHATENSVAAEAAAPTGLGGAADAVFLPALLVVSPGTIPRHRVMIRQQ
jgi:hypothetical protein